MKKESLDAMLIDQWKGQVQIFTEGNCIFQWHRTVQFPEGFTHKMETHLNAADSSHWYIKGMIDRKIEHVREVSLLWSGL